MERKKSISIGFQDVKDKLFKCIYIRIYNFSSSYLWRIDRAIWAVRVTLWAWVEIGECVGWLRADSKLDPLTTTDNSVWPALLLSTSCRTTRSRTFVSASIMKGMGGKSPWYLAILRKNKEAENAKLTRNQKELHTDPYCWLPGCGEGEPGTFPEQSLSPAGLCSTNAAKLPSPPSPWILHLQAHFHYSHSPENMIIMLKDSKLTLYYHEIRDCGWQNFFIL